MLSNEEYVNNMTYIEVLKEIVVYYTDGEILNEEHARELLIEILNDQE